MSCARVLPYLARFALVVLSALVAPGLVACGGGASVAVDAGGVDLGPLIPDHCSGSIQSKLGSAQGSFIDCTISLERDSLDETLRLLPTKYKGSALSMVLAAAVVPGSLARKAYGLADLVAPSQVVFAFQDQGQRYVAGKDDTGTLTGSLSLTLYTLPSPPAADSTDWQDTSVHGSFSATLHLDPNSPGPVGDTMQFEATF